MSLEDITVRINPSQKTSAVGLYEVPREGTLLTTELLTVAGAGGRVSWEMSGNRQSFSVTG